MNILYYGMSGSAANPNLGWPLVIIGAILMIVLPIILGHFCCSDNWIPVVGIIVGLCLIIGICNLLNAYFSSKATAGFTCSVRKACFSKANSLSPQDFAKFGESTLLNRTMADVANITVVTINALRLWMAIPILIVTELFIIALNNVYIFMVLAFFFIMTVTFLIVFMAKSRKNFEELQKKLDKINLNMRERIVGVRHIRAFGNEKLVYEKSAKGNEDVYDEAISANSKINFLSPIAMVVMNWVVVLIYILGTQQIKEGMASISQLLLIFQYISSFILSLMTIPFLINVLPKGMVSARRINELLNFEPTKYETSQHLKKDKMDYKINSQCKLKVLSMQEIPNDKISQIEFKCDDNGDFRLKTYPDFVFFDGDTPFMILDAKFKLETWVSNGNITNANLDDYTKCLRDMVDFNSHATGVIYPTNNKDEKASVHYISEHNRTDHFYLFPVIIPDVK